MMGVFFASIATGSGCATRSTRTISWTASSKTANRWTMSLRTAITPAILSMSASATMPRSKARGNACTNFARNFLAGCVPSSATITATVLYARTEESQQPWTESRVAPGQDVGRARFADKTFERAESDGTKQVCTGFSAWDGEQAYSARLVVTFVASPTAHEVSQAAVVPISDVVSLAPAR